MVHLLSDFGSVPGVIHVAGASMALVGTIMMGSRSGRFAIGVRSDEVEYGNKTLQYLGLLFGQSLALLLQMPCMFF